MLETIAYTALASAGSNKQYKIYAQICLGPGLHVSVSFTSLIIIESSICLYYSTL